MNSATKEAIESKLPAGIDDEIKGELDRLRAFALANPCIAFEDAQEFHAAAKNQLSLRFSKRPVYGVIVSAMIFADYESEFDFSWQITVCFGEMEIKPDRVITPIQFLRKNELDELTKTRELVLELVADLGENPSSLFRESRVLTASCPVSFAEFTRIWRILSDEQEQFFTEERNSPERVRAQNKSRAASGAQRLKVSADLFRPIDSGAEKKFRVRKPRPANKNKFKNKGE